MGRAAMAIFWAAIILAASAGAAIMGLLWWAFG